MTIRLNKEACYKTIVNERGSPITTAVIILEEIVNNYQLQLASVPDNPKVQNLYSFLKEGWITNYKYFEEKFSFKHHKTRYAFWKLEEYSLITRERVFYGISSDGTKGGSEIRLTLNLKNVQPLLFKE
jgi:hypothetical protein